MNSPFDEWIEVTQEHIDRGVRGITTSCAVALALQDHFGAMARVGVTTVSIENTELYPDDTPGEVSFDLPGYVSMWIESFDSDKVGVKPMKFRLITRWPGTTTPAAPRDGPTSNAHSSWKREISANTD